MRPTQVPTLNADFLMFFIDKLRVLWRKPPPIQDQHDLKEFLVGEIAKVTGELVIKYSLKRLGKIHYNLAKEQEYIQELVSCQVKLHAEIVADFGHLMARLMKWEKVNECENLQSLLQAVHEEYVQTAPAGTQVTPCLEESHFSKADIQVRDLALITGKFLYQTLPMTDNLYQSNVHIFQGQVRTAYIQLLQKLGRRANYEVLRQNLIANPATEELQEKE